jgi:hypothetical protein
MRPAIWLGPRPTRGAVTVLLLAVVLLFVAARQLSREAPDGGWSLLAAVDQYFLQVGAIALAVLAIISALALVSLALHSEGPFLTRQVVLSRLDVMGAVAMVVLTSFMMPDLSLWVGYIVMGVDMTLVAVLVVLHQFVS